MALPNSRPDPQHLRAIVDMGSNGIRFSISSLQPPTARIMPTLYQHRAGISLYDAQYPASDSNERVPIDDKTISNVVTAFKHFKSVCDDFEVPQTQVTVLATEATRTAKNSEDFRRQIKDAVGWDVRMLAKEDEGRVGGMGIASSLPEVSGLVMDLGGGSTQLSWLAYSHGDSTVRMPENGSVSMPYGAAAMRRRLEEAEKNGTVKKLEEEVEEAVRRAYEDLKIPDELNQAAEEQGGFTLYLSGGGFRGWGYILMSKHPVSPYPIPVINGFKASRHAFMDTKDIKNAASDALDDEDEGIFRVSDRRASQVPAVAFLVNTLAETLPKIKEVRFCQGGVREGHLFTALPAEVVGQHPLVVATQPYSNSPAAPIVELLTKSLPPASEKNSESSETSALTPIILEAFANLMYLHATHSKDLQASSALRSTTSGILAAVHGILHENRTLLALLLCARWGGDVPPADTAFKQNLERLVESPWTLWWIEYLGAVSALICAVYPAGIGHDADKRLRLKAEKGSNEEIVLHVSFDADEDVFAGEIKDIEKTGKKKNWIGGKEGIGHKVNVQSRTVS